jgi:glycosyltransferase involved in cell wall biosynthesis
MSDMPSILLCMTPGVSLHTWAKQGILNREIRPYLSLIDAGWKIKILTFRREEAKLFNLPQEVQTVFFPHHRLLNLFPYTYTWLAPMVDVFQTNQSRGAWYYTRAARYWRKPLLLRCGFINGEGLESVYGLTEKVRSYQDNEAKAFRQATLIETTTTYQANWIVERYRIHANKIVVIPNYVDTTLFHPDPDIPKLPRSVVSVGTLHAVKRFDLLVEACAIAGVSRLTIYGDGPEELNLMQLAEKMNINLELPGRVSNEELPNHLKKFQVFAITSVREGHPKALMEAFACGLSCVGVDVVGIRECILESGAGRVVEAIPEAIAHAIRELFNNPGLRAEFGQRGHTYVNATMNYSLIFSRKMSLLEQCLHQDKSG